MWQRTSATNLPSKGITVETKIDDHRGVRNEAMLVYQDNLWWSGNMYVYYTPTHWRYVV